jgi:hypothetical protein
MSKALRFLQYVMLLGAFVVSLSSCEDDEAVTTEMGTISGTVKGETGETLSDVTVTISGVKEEDIVVTTDANGKYSVGNVSVKLHAVTFAKKNWLRTSVTVNVENFDESKNATVDIMLLDASKMIAGTITDARNNDAPLEGVTVTVGVAGTATSGGDGKFLIESLIADNYTVTYSKANYVSVTKKITKADFDPVTGIATANIRMGGKEILLGLTADDLRSADKWYFNEYRGGRNGDSGAHWDWSTDYMGTLDFRGNWEEQNEGTTLRIRNDEGDRTNPANTDVFDSFVFGSKLITADNKILSLRVRTHSATDAAPTVWGVQVVDLSAAEPVAVKIGETKGLNSEAYRDFDFDLSAYVGKEVIIAVGTYRAATGDYWKQLVLRAIRFADKKVVNWDWLPGTDVVNGWKLTTETVRSTMPTTKKVFTGISPVGGNRDNYIDAYRKWREVDHVAANWSLVPISKDTEPFAGEGYIIKTQGTAGVNLVVPQSLLYSKFAISPGTNKLTLYVRTFGGNTTFFKVSAVQNSGTVKHLEPTAVTANQASAAAEGAWEFRHDAGGGAVNTYAKFEYDLSEFNGEEATIVLGVYKGGDNTDENKLCIRQIELN